MVLIAYWNIHMDLYQYLLNKIVFEMAFGMHPYPSLLLAYC